MADTFKQIVSEGPATGRMSVTAGGGVPSQDGQVDMYRGMAQRRMDAKRRSRSGPGRSSSKTTTKQTTNHRWC